MGTARTKANNKYNAKAYDRMTVQVRKGKREEIQAFAAKKGISVNEYIKSLIAVDMEDNDL